MEAVGAKSETQAELTEVRAEEDFDRAKLGLYLRDRVAGGGQPLEVKQFHGGHSNLTYLLRLGDQEWVMRRPPLGPVAPSAHDMGREYRVLSKLWQAYPPAPRAVLMCADPSIIGAPFYIMERMHGTLVRMREPMPAELDGAKPAVYRDLSCGFIDALADLHMVDFQRIGLGDLGKPMGFVQRQIRGWMERWERAKTRDVPLMERLGDWLLTAMPPDQPPAILHNDFFLHNVMLAKDNPGRVVGVLDWEMSTLGNPLVDLGIALAYWRERSDPEELLDLSEGYPHTLRPGFLSRREMAERYAARTAKDVSAIDYYVALALWKTATVVEQIYVRYVRGQTSDPRFPLLGKQPPILARAAARVAAQLGFRE